MTKGTAPIEALARALADRPDTASVTADDIRPLADTGLAHWHARIGETGWLARMPKQSQMKLGAAENLLYQANSFRAAEPSGHTPKLIDIVAPTAELPLGALIVEAIEGRVPRLPDDLAAIAEALAALHRCPIEGPASGLKRAANPLTAMLLEVRDQAEFLEPADIDDVAELDIRSELDKVFRQVERLGRPPRTLISFDAHPGNFLIEEWAGEAPRAVLVDLDKMRLSSPGFDLAHATLYTSTTWDPNTSAVLSGEETLAFYRAWIAAMGDDAGQHLPFLEISRRLMWLWSATWCAKWQVLSGETAKEAAETSANAEDWSEEKSEAALIAHVAERVGHYLRPETVARVRATLAIKL